MAHRIHHCRRHLRDRCRTLLSLIFALMTLGLAVNQVASGLALTILGVGLSGLIGAGFVGERITPAPHLYIPGLTDIPMVGRILLARTRSSICRWRWSSAPAVSEVPDSQRVRRYVDCPPAARSTSPACVR